MHRFQLLILFQRNFFLFFRVHQVVSFWSPTFCPHPRLKGYLPDFFQSLEYLPLPGEIGRYRDPIFLASLTYRQPAAPARLHSPAPFHQPVLLIGSLHTRHLLHPDTSHYLRILDTLGTTMHFLRLLWFGRGILH